MYYFFRNVRDYNELLAKTEDAKRRNSLNKKKALIRKTFILKEDEFEKISSNFMKNQKVFFENKESMYIENGIWNCIALQSKRKKFLVMSNGYQYARFVALDELKEENEISLTNN